MKVDPFDRRRFLLKASVAALATHFDIKPAGAQPGSKAILDRSQKIVVIGSGIGAMASAALLTKAGHEVTVLEMNSLIGGHARHLQRHQLKFSCGPQYVWNFQEGEVGDRFLKYLGIDQANPFHLMDSQGFETIFIGSQGSMQLKFAVPMGMERFSEALQKAFPKEQAAIEQCFADMIAVYHGFRAFYRRYGISTVIGAAWDLLARMELPWRSKTRMLKAAFGTLEEWFDSYDLSDPVRRICYGHGGIFVENESTVSALLYILATGNYHRGASIPQHGFYTLFDSMKAVIESRGGAVLTDKKVTRIDCQDNKAIQVACADGSSYPLDLVISNISPRLTAKLLPTHLQIPFAYETGPSIMIALLAVRGYKHAISPLQGRNYWWLDGQGETNYFHRDQAEPPAMLYITSHTASGFGRMADDSDLDSLTVFAAGDYAAEKLLLEARTELHDRFRALKLEQIIDLLEANIFPGLRQHLVHKELVSATDLVRDTDSEQGNIYGKRMSVHELHKGPISPLPVSNLYNVSATQHAAGIAAGIATAVDLHQELTGIKV